MKARERGVRGEKYLFCVDRSLQNIFVVWGNCRRLLPLPASSGQSTQSLTAWSDLALWIPSREEYRSACLYRDFVKILLLEYCLGLKVRLRPVNATSGDYEHPVGSVHYPPSAAVLCIRLAPCCVLALIFV